MEKIKQEIAPNNHRVIYFDVNWLFTKLHLEKTIDITHKKYMKNEISIQISRPDIKELLAKEENFKFHYWVF